MSRSWRRSGSHAIPLSPVGTSREGVDTMLAGGVDTGKAILRGAIKATVGFEKLGEATGAPAKSLIRMLGPRGNQQARNASCAVKRPSAPRASP
jgi:hypothetical protein